MIPYLIISVFPLILGQCINWRKSVEQKKKFLITCGVVFVLFLGLRSRYLGSSDTLNYYNLYLRAINCRSWAEYYRPNFIEIGFMAVCWFFSRFFKFAQFILIVSAIIYIYSIFRYIYKNSDNPVIAVIFYCTLGLLMFEMQGMRQSIAISICMFAYEEAKNRKIFKFVLLVVLASLFHKTAVVFLIVYFVSGRVVSKGNVAISLFAAGLVILMSSRIISIANDFFEMNYNSPIDSGGFVTTTINFLIVIYALLFCRKMWNDPSMGALFFISLICAVVYLMRYTGTLAAERISFYFSFAQISLITNTISDMNFSNKRISLMLIPTLSILLFLYHLHGSLLVPYRFV